MYALNVYKMAMENIGKNVTIFTDRDLQILCETLL